MTPEEFVQNKKLNLSKDTYVGYEIPYSYLCNLIKEYSDIKIKELMDIYADNDADGFVFCGKCGKLK